MPVTVPVPVTMVEPWISFVPEPRSVPSRSNDPNTVASTPTFRLPDEVRLISARAPSVRAYALVVMSICDATGNGHSIGG